MYFFASWLQAAWQSAAPQTPSESHLEYAGTMVVPADFMAGSAGLWGKRPHLDTPRTCAGATSTFPLAFGLPKFMQITQPTDEIGPTLQTAFEHRRLFRQVVESSRL